MEAERYVTPILFPFSYKKSLGTIYKQKKYNKDKVNTKGKIIINCFKTPYHHSIQLQADLVLGRSLFLSEEFEVLEKIRQVHNNNKTIFDLVLYFLLKSSMLPK